MALQHERDRLTGESYRADVAMAVRGAKNRSFCDA
jgi:hypothetical protein